LSIIESRKPSRNLGARFVDNNACRYRYYPPCRP